MAATAKTFLTDSTQEVEVDVLTGPNANGLCKVAFGKKILVRHRSKLTDPSEQAKVILGTK
jgi:hypothetical protein